MDNYLKFLSLLWICFISSWSCATLDHYWAVQKNQFQVPHLALQLNSRTQMDSAQYGVFRAYWTLKDPQMNLQDLDANGIPDWVDIIGRTLDSTYQRMLHLGFAEVPMVAGYIPVVIKQFAEGAYALTDEGYTFGDNPHSPQKEKHSKSAVMYFQANGNDWNSSQPEDVLRVTAAHELLHVFHFAYEVNEQPWILEAEATALERMVYPQIKDNYHYLSAWLSHPEAPVDYFTATDCSGSFCAEQGHEYGLWPLMYSALAQDSLAFLRRNEISAYGADLSKTDQSRANLDSLFRTLNTNLWDRYGQFWSEVIQKKSAYGLVDADIWRRGDVFTDAKISYWNPQSCSDVLRMDPIRGGGIRIIQLASKLPKCQIKFLQDSRFHFSLLSSQKKWISAPELLKHQFDPIWENAYLLVQSTSPKTVEDSGSVIQLYGSPIAWDRGAWRAQMNFSSFIFDPLGRPLGTQVLAQGDTIRLSAGINLVKMKFSSGSHSQIIYQP